MASWVEPDSTKVLARISSDIITSTSSSIPIISGLVPALYENREFIVDNAYTAALKIGKTPELCAFGSLFAYKYNACEVCCKSNNFQAAFAAYIEPQFRQFVDYCKSEASETTVTGVVGSTTAATTSSKQSFSSLPSSLSPFTKTFSGLTSSPSGSAYSTITTINTEILPAFNGSTFTNFITLRNQPKLNSSSPTINSQPKPLSDHSRFHGILIGSIFGGLSVIAFSCWICWKVWRNRRLQISTADGTVGEEKHDEKAQLHSDSLPPKYPQELDESPRGPIAELQAIEPVSAELSGTVDSVARD
ncbi:hypothetical protein NHQ30_007252 [Ciborinia camelliae]|nr:hypothetical protein NHQ30_007252 [Ciborinia camelliae]